MPSFGKCPRHGRFGESRLCLLCSDDGLAKYTTEALYALFKKIEASIAADAQDLVRLATELDRRGSKLPEHMAKLPERVATGCDDCPVEQLGICLIAPEGHEDVDCYRETAPDAASPDWCPLRKASILLRLEPIE